MCIGTGPPRPPFGAAAQPMACFGCGWMACLLGRQGCPSSLGSATFRQLAAQAARAMSAAGGQPWQRIGMQRQPWAHRSLQATLMPAQAGSQTGLQMTRVGPPGPAVMPPSTPTAATSSSSVVATAAAFVTAGFLGARGPQLPALGSALEGAPLWITLWQAVSSGLGCCAFGCRRGTQPPNFQTTPPSCSR